MNEACATPIPINSAADQTNSSPDLVHYVIVRGDLPHGSQVAQAVHAAGESVVQPVPSGTIAVALAARDEAHLADLHLAFLNAVPPVEHVQVIESDGALMAIGCQPTYDRDAIRRHTSSLPLVGGRMRK